MSTPYTTSLVFIGGVHGIGKSTVCEQLSIEFGLQGVTASSLIQHEAQPGDSTGKAVANVEENQRDLISALTQLRSNDSSLILDGHYSLLHSNGSIVPIPIPTFEQINPAFVLVAVLLPVHSAAPNSMKMVVQVVVVFILAG